ncbi:AMP-binding protein [Francisella sp. 19X1-34]|uniref:AMP-binding protein n=1 Tax=Francisella sp. 19X1-34 TaxID=3087177 RepID=UPI002E2ED196|nr:AMP-binding protein [Francisella sp. 19X1-34]MED7787523.1 AMP-binding protein [Francisella sp. 19X1-34]
MVGNIFSLFESSCSKFGTKTSLVVDGVQYTYNELLSESRRVANVVRNYKHKNVGIFGLRSLTCYQGILGVLSSGKTYVPLNPKFPSERNRTIIEMAELDLIVADANGLEQIAVIADSLKKNTVLICPQISQNQVPYSIKGKFEIYTSDIVARDTIDLKETSGGEYAYIMFTSGSTGLPKGVPVSHENVFSYINYLKRRYDINSDDRFSQTFDLTFDLSVHDMFLSWSVGAALYVIPEANLMAPAKFIRENKLTIWFSVPSMAQFMNKFRMLKDSCFPSLRYSFFCGEALQKSIAIAWQKAASNSILENIYGPTEATIGITHYLIPRDETKILEYNGIVSIGEIFSTQRYCLIDEKNKIIDNCGELCLSGTQITAGYYDKPKQTAESYIKFPNNNKVWYKTGDIVKFEKGHLFYLSRKDHQVKIRGYRIELDEINLAIREYTCCDLVYTIPYPLSGGAAESLYSFVDSNCVIDKNLILKYLKDKLPEYMVPKNILYIKDFPLNSNGKIDIKKLSTKVG